MDLVAANLLFPMKEGTSEEEIPRMRASGVPAIIEDVCALTARRDPLSRVAGSTPVPDGETGASADTKGRIVCMSVP